MGNPPGAIVIVGAGHAGGRAALRLRSEGFEGPITLVGDEMWPPHERPPISKSLLAGTAKPESLFLLSNEKLREKNIDFLAGISATSIDRAAKAVLLSSGERLLYDKLIIATGARARRLAVPGIDSSVVSYLRTIEDALQLRERLQPGARIVLIGGGFIGLEVAATAAQAGCKVTVLEAADRLLSRAVPPEVGDFFAEIHRQNHVDVRFSMVVTEIGTAKTGAVVRTSDGQGFDADAVIVGVGSVPNTELASSAGLAVDDGILTDEYGRTSDPAIFAAGDVTRHYSPTCSGHVRLEAWQNAQNQSSAIAKIMLGGTDPYSEVPWFWTDQYEVNFQSAGSFHLGNKIVHRGSIHERKSTLFYLDGHVVIGGACVNNPRDMKVLKKMISDRVSVDKARLADPAVALVDTILQVKQ